MKSVILAFIITAWLIPILSAKAQCSELPEGTTTQSYKDEKIKPASLSVVSQEERDSQPSTKNPSRETDYSADPTDGFIKWANAVSTIVIALFAMVTGIAIWGQIKTARDIERARISVLVEDPEDPPTCPQPSIPQPLQIYRVIYSVANYGKTPAIVTAIDAVYQIVPKGSSLPEEPNYTKEGKTLEGTVMIPPNHPRPFLGWVDISPYEFKGLTTQDAFFYVYGRIKYTDIFKRKRETRFCYLYNFPLGVVTPKSIGFRPAGPSKKYNNGT